MMKPLVAEPGCPLLGLQVAGILQVRRVVVAGQLPCPQVAAALLGDCLAEWAGPSVTALSACNVGWLSSNSWVLTWLANHPACALLVLHGRFRGHRGEVNHQVVALLREDDFEVRRPAAIRAS